MTPYVAFPSPPELRRDSEQLVANVRAQVKSSQTDIMMRIMTTFTDEVLKVFFLDTIELMNMRPFMSKIVHGAVASMRKTSISVSGTVIRKLDNRQLVPLAEHICTLMLTSTHAATINQPYVGFAIQPDVQQRLARIIADMRAGDARAHVQAFSNILIEITDLAVEAYLRTPITILNLGLILRKLAEGGMSVIQGAVHMVIRKLAPDMEAHQLLALADHLESLIITDPRLGPTASSAS